MTDIKTGIYDDIYSKLRKQICWFFIFGWLMVTVLEGVLLLITKFHGIEITTEHVLKTLVFPASIDLVFIIILCCILVSKKIPNKTKTESIVTCSIIISYVLALAHSSFVISIGFFVFPILISTVFVNYKALVWTIISGIVGTIVFGLAGPFFDVYHYANNVWLNVAIGAFAMVLFGAISFFITHIHLKRECVLSQSQAEVARLSKESRFDGLTGLQNHTSFYTIFENKLMKARHEKMPFSIAMIDVDNFKSVNDTYGHASGDEVLKYISKTIQNVVGNNGTVFRYGGDEFAVIFINPDSQYNAGLLSRLVGTVSSSKEIAMEDVHVTLSIGYYDVKEFSMSAEGIFFRADRALYQAKYSGKNQLVTDI